MSGPKTVEEALALPVLTQWQYVERITNHGLSGAGIDGDMICICSDRHGEYQIEHVQPEGWVRVLMGL